MSTQYSKDFWLTSLRADAADFRAVAVEAEPTAAVPSCPGWSVLDLIRHVGVFYGWVRSHTARGDTSLPDMGMHPAHRDLSTLPGPPDVIAWWDAELAALLELLESVDPQLPAWNWAPQAKVAGFWHRRAAHELAIHRWDIQMAVAMAEPVESKLAGDGVSEVLDTWLPSGRRKGPTDRQGVVQLIATDLGQDWYVRLRGEGVSLLDTATLLDDTDPHARVAAAGTASDLMLALYGRVGFDVLDIDGDEGLLESLRTG
jgi:uncharacterized protein (TIGR03083 family)